MTSFLIEDSKWTVKSAEQFLRSIRYLEIKPDEMMVSLDVVSLFTSTPTVLPISTIDGLLQEKVYEQKKGTTMSSPLSGLIAEAVLQKLERLVFRSYSPKFWALYVDDTFAVIKRNDVQDFKVLLNSIFPDIQLTMEEENNNQLPFLDVNITRMTNGGSEPRHTERQQIMRPKDQLPPVEQSAVVYSTPCQDCSARYVGETGKRLCTRLHEHQLAVNCEDKLSLVYGHIQQEKHSFAFGEASVIGRASNKMARLVLKSWSSAGTINIAIDLHPAYQALRTRLQSSQTGLTAPANKSRFSQQQGSLHSGEKEPAGVRRPTPDIDPPTRPNSRTRFTHATAANQPIR
ncbi:hypothetical protein SprV_0200632900 [Sparganum proliferum]